MNAVSLQTLLKDTAATRLIDVRSASEFENGHIAGAYNLPLDQLSGHTGDVRAACGPVVLICQSGQRAQRADALLRAAGMVDVHVLDGGMTEWQSRGLPVRRVRARVSLERQVRIVAGTIVASGAIAALIVSPWFAIVPALVGSGLVFAGLSNTCAMGMLLARLPYNQSAASCDTHATVRQFLAPDGPQG